MDKIRQSYIYAGLAIFFWSTVPTAFKIGLGELDILPMLTIAVLTSTLILFIIVLAGNKVALIRKTTGKESNLVYLTPFISLVFVHFIFHEPVYYTIPTGLLLIISGILNNYF
jgi:hypothetical protein